MKKILLAVVSEIEDKGTFDNIIKKFEEEHYEIHVIQDPNGDLDITQLPFLIDYIKKESKEKVERIVVLSNILEVILIWYRCYNALVDDYVYFIERKPSAYSSKCLNDYRTRDFYASLASFKGIQNELIQGKIYVNFSMENYKQHKEFLFQNNNFPYFHDLAFFDYKKKKEKQLINKKYRFKHLEYSFDIFEGVEEETVKLEGHTYNQLQINNEFIKTIISHYYFFPYAAISIYSLPNITFEKKKQITHILFGEAAKLDDDVKKYIYTRLMEYVSHKETQFLEKIYFLTLCVLLGVKDSELHRKIIHAMLQDADHVQYHYPLLMNTLFYNTKNGLETYPQLLQERQQILDKIVDYYIKNNNLGTSEKVAIQNRKELKRIAVFVGQLLSLQHSPTLSALSYVKNLKRYYPNYEIKLFVEDIFCYSPNEVAFPYVFQSADSRSCREIHNAFLDGYDIPIHYSNVQKQRNKRIEEDINELYKFNPDVIWAYGDDLGIVREIAYSHYPIVDLNLSKISYSLNADIFISVAETEEVLAEYVDKGINISKEKVYKHKPAVELMEPWKKIKRSIYGLRVDDFVVVTVGTRLDADMTRNFIDMIAVFLEKNKNVKWLIVGQADHDYLRKMYIHLFKRKQIVLISYEDDLAALYKICDVYINPFRQGGGYSAAIAMNQAIPVLTLYGDSDVGSYVNEENACTDTQEYMVKLEELYKNQIYRKQVGQIMKHIIQEKFNFKSSIDELVTFLSSAIMKRYCEHNLKH